MIPLYGFLQGDTIGLLVLAQPDDTAAVLCAKLQSAAAVRVAPEATVAELALQPLERIDVVAGVD